MFTQSLRLGVVILELRMLVLGILVGGLTVTCAVAGGVSDESATPAAFVGRYCLDCHGANDPEADFALERLDDLSESAARSAWQRVWRQLDSREMPPADAQQPSEAERDAVLAAIVDKHGAAPQPMSHDLWSLSPPVRAEPIESNNQKSNGQMIDRLIDRRLDQAGLVRSPRADRRTILRRVTFDLTGLLPTLDETRSFVEDADDFEVAYGRVVDRLLDSPHYGERWAQHWLDLIRWAETVGFETNAERRDAWHYRDWVIHAMNDDMPYDRFIANQLIGDVTVSDAALGFLVAGPANLPGQIGRDEEAMRQARQDELDEVVQTVSQALFGLTIGCARCHDHKFDPISQRDYYSMQAIFAGLQYGTRRLRGPTNDEWTAQVPEAREQLNRLRSELETLRVELELQKPLADVHSESFRPVRADAARMEIDATTKGSASLYEFQVWSTQSTASDPRNVALASSGAVPSASSFALANQTRHFNNLVDGSVDPRQAFPWVAATDEPAWLQIDFGEPTEIDRLTWHQGSSTPADYRLKVRDADSGRWIMVGDSRDRLPRLDDMRSTDAIELAGVSSVQVERLMKLIRKVRRQQSELRRLSDGPQTYAARFSDSPEKLWLLERGDPMQPAGEAIAALPAVLAPTIPASNPRSEPQRRRMLVEHLTRPDHPLTARVMVNRIWQQHFGRGLVETASDFGRMGQPPTHPELLDWLAVEFVESGWSIKHMQRLIATAETYTQSSFPRERAAEIDAQSQLLWRFPPRRLDAEIIRDSILQASGKLNETMYGRGFDFFNQRGGLSDYQPKQTFDTAGSRRMIYAHKIRMQSVDVFGAFDCPDAGQMTPRRNQSITPIQSLGLLNSPFVNRQAAFFARRVRGEVGEDLQSCVDRVFQIALTRAPNANERAALVALARDQGLGQACRVIFNTSEFVSLQ